MTRLAAGTHARPARLRAVGSLALLVALLVWLGPAPFVAAAGRLDVTMVLAALGLGGLATIAAAWRWRAVAEALEVPVPLGWAVAAYYRSQLLNSVLPGGVLGDVHRGVAHGRAEGRLSLALRAVAWERLAGQAVALGLTVVLAVTLTLTGGAELAPVTGWLVSVVVLGAGLGAGLAWLARRRGSWPVAADVRRLAAGVRPLDVLVPSVVATLAHATVFVLAADRAAPGLPASAALALGLVVLAISAAPVSVAGWGPREVAAGGLFPLMGATAAQGVEASVVYGLLALVATLPGVLVLATAPRVTARNDLEVADA